MAHFAEIDGNNIVIRVLVVPDEQEHRGADYLATDLGLGGTWVQTSYTASMRKNYAGIGYAWDAARDAFIPPQPFPSWSLDESTCRWQPPVPHPPGNRPHRWDEASGSWQPFTA